MSKSLIVAALGSIILAWAGAHPARADEPCQCAVSIVFENDVFYDTDRHYTNGVRVSGEIGREELPNWLLSAAHAFPFFSDGGEVRARLGIGQSIYTNGPHK